MMGQKTQGFARNSATLPHVKLHFRADASVREMPFFDLHHHEP